MKNLKLTPSLSFRFCRKKTRRRLFRQKTRQLEHNTPKKSTDTSTDNATDKCFTEFAATHTKKNTMRGKQAFLTINLHAQRCCLHAVKRIVAVFKRTENSGFKLSSKSVNKRTFEDCGDGQMLKFRKVSNEYEQVVSTKKRLGTAQHRVAIYGQTRKVLSHCYSQTIAEEDGKQTKPVPLLNITLIFCVCFLKTFF